MNSIELHCLNAVTDDYENVASATASVRRDFGQVTENNVEVNLRQLALKGLINLFRYDHPTQKFVREPEGSLLADMLWFYITADGRTYLDLNWQKETRCAQPED